MWVLKNWDVRPSDDDSEVIDETDFSELTNRLLVLALDAAKVRRAV